MAKKTINYKSSTVTFQVCIIFSHLHEMQIKFNRFCCCGKMQFRIQLSFSDEICPLKTLRGETAFYKLPLFKPRQLPFVRNASRCQGQLSCFQAAFNNSRKIRSIRKKSFTILLFCLQCPPNIDMMDIKGCASLNN